MAQLLSVSMGFIGDLQNHKMFVGSGLQVTRCLRDRSRAKESVAEGLKV